MTFVNVRDFAPALGDDWTPAFREAVEAAISGGHAGVLVPADPVPYTVRKPAANQTPSIDLRGPDRSGFVLRGEGDRSVISMIGPGSWRLIHIGGQAVGVQVRDLSLNGAGLENADQQSHLIVVGTSIRVPGGARAVAIVNCTLEQAAGDAVAIVPASSTEPSEEVADITVACCRLRNNGRSGVSNQRFGKRVSILHNQFTGNQDQDIDFEPTGDLPDSGPSGYLILGNTMVRQGRSVAVTLSGTSPDSPSRRNTFAHNQILGGRLGLHDAQDLSIVGNHVEVGPGQPGTVVRVGGSVERLLFAGNTVVRPPNAAPGTLLNVASGPKTWAFATDSAVDAGQDVLTRNGHGLQTGTGPLRASTPTGGGNVLPAGLTTGVDYWAIRIDANHLQLAASRQQAELGQFIDLLDAGSGRFELQRTGLSRSVTIRDNLLSTHVPAPAGEALVTFTNVAAASFRDNELTSSAGIDIPIALKLDTTKARKRPLAGWEVVGNRFRGDARLTPELDEPGTGTFEIAVSVAAGDEKVRDVRISGNTFVGCSVQVRLQAELPGSFANRPAVVGNTGAGAALHIQGTVPAVLVGGNEQVVDETGPGATAAGARYCGAGEPGFKAAIGSLYSRTDGTVGKLLYINTDGASAWAAIA